MNNPWKQKHDHMFAKARRQRQEFEERIAELEAENATLEAENERYKAVLKSIEAEVKKEEEDTLGWISYAARMAKAALKGGG